MTALPSTSSGTPAVGSPRREASGPAAWRREPGPPPLVVVEGPGSDLASGPTDERRDGAASGPRVRLRVSCPRGDTELITVVGPVDEETLDRLVESWPYGCARLRSVVVDLAGVQRLDRPARRLLEWSLNRAGTDGVDLRVVAPARLERQFRRVSARRSDVLSWHRSVTDALGPGGP